MRSNAVMRRQYSFVLGGLLLAHTAQSHHSSLGLYDVERTVEVEGIVTSVYWRNPHPRYTLAVETTHVDVPYFDGGNGTPQSRAIRLVEHFILSATEDRLDYWLIVDDPETFTEPLELTTYYIWRPEIQVEPFACRE